MDQNISEDIKAEDAKYLVSAVVPPGAGASLSHPFTLVASHLRARALRDP